MYLDDPENLKKRGLQIIKLEGYEENFLMDMEGNIYNFEGEFIAQNIGEDDDEEEEENEIEIQ